MSGDVERDSHAYRFGMWSRREIAKLVTALVIGAVLVTVVIGMLAALCSKVSP